MKVLTTGGAGYIGSHTIISLVEAGHEVIVADDLRNSSRGALQRVEQITGTSLPFYQIDVCDKAALERVFTEHEIDAVVHFAGLKAVGESVEKPLLYYRNNIDSTLSLCEVMANHGVKKIVFSSTACVYGEPRELPFKETTPPGKIANPYGQSKAMVEQILMDASAADQDLQVSILRYFNPVGAHKSGLIGEDPNGVPNNLMPYIAQVAVGKLDKLRIFGGDYETPDGTGIRDYVHVMDLAEGHVAALEHLQPGAAVYNLGTGQGQSVLQVLHAFEKACGKELPYEIVARRPGDLPSYYADVSKAQTELDWKATRTLDDMCADTWRWQSQNPNGFEA